jgi:hypothetical protein
MVANRTYEFCLMFQAKGTAVLGLIHARAIHFPVTAHRPMAETDIPGSYFTSTITQPCPRG